MPALDLSLIIPCYNEEEVLKDNVDRIIEVLENTRFNYEIIFIDDCSSDKTAEIIKELISSNQGIRMSAIFHEQNQGRGKTVTEGILRSEARIAGFIDIDLSTPARYIPTLIMEIDRGADIATALRIYKLSLSAIPRWVISKGYRSLVKIFFRLSINDTETGCKFFRIERIIPVLREIKDTHWFWDTEVMVRSCLMGLKITEIPSIFIRRGIYTKVKIFSDSMRHLINLIRLKQELKNARVKGS